MNLTNLRCLTSVLPGDTSDSRNSSYKVGSEINQKVNTPLQGLHRLEKYLNLEGFLLS